MREVMVSMSSGMPEEYGSVAFVFPDFVIASP